MRAILHILADLIVPALLGAAVYVMEISDWDHGVARGAALAGTTFVVAVLYLWRGRREATPVPRAYLYLLCLVAGLLIGWRSVQSWEKLNSVPLDIAFSTLDSIKAVVHEHKDPYANPIDSRKEAPKDARGFRYYHGYKYLPAMLLVYAPLAVKWEFPGIMFTNYLLFIAVGVLIYLLGGRGCRPEAGGWRSDAGDRSATDSGLQPTDSGLSTAGLRGLVLYLSLGLIGLELFEKGVNDFAQMAPLLLGFYALSRGRMTLAGVAVGFSLGAKLLPGAIIALMFLPLAWNRRFVFAAVFTALALYLPFLLWHPREFIANVFLFNLDRPPNTSSIAYYLPKEWQRPWLWTGGTLSVMLLAGWLLKRGKDWRGLVFMSMAVVTVFLLFGPMVHRNYLLWVIPLYCVVLAWSAYPAEKRSAVSVQPSA